jgi:proton-translocating NAD(P)+ transhydrogenase subunit alpha
MIIGVPRETLSGERRVGLVGESVERLVKAGLTVVVEAGAGEACGRPDAKFADAGGRIAGADEVLGQSDVIVKVRPPEPAQVARLREGAVLISLLDPVVNGPLLELLAARRVTALALERIPRVARAQSMDVLSSMSTIAGYKAALIAADRLPRFFPMIMSAAGSIQPARVLVIGAGVAGLQAIATARRLGARVEAFDPRPAAREQVESLGARFVGAELLDASVETAGGYAREQTEEERAKQREALKASVALSDAVICSALVAGRRAPQILDEAMVASMAPGSVIVDLAAEQGGNCALTVAGAEVERHGVLIAGPVNVASLLPHDASRMFSRNVCNLLNHLVRKGEMIPLVEDEIARACLGAHGGQVWGDGRPVATAAAAGGPP